MRAMSVLLLGGALVVGCSVGEQRYENLSKVSREAAGAPDIAEVEKKPAEKDPAAVARKVIYTAEVTLVVEDFDKAQARVKDLVQKEKGYVAQSEVGGTPGTPRWGRWKVRIPVERLDPFLTAVGELGELERTKLDSRDVTEEYYDLEARIRNKKVEEDRLLKHLEKSTGKLEEILAVEKELSRVRDEIDRHQGRLRLLANLTDLTTVTIMVRERKGYLPESAPGYGTALGRTFSGSINAMVEVAKALVLALVAAAPWLLVLAVVAVPLYRLRQRLRPASGPAPAASPEAKHEANQNEGQASG